LPLLAAAVAALLAGGGYLAATDPRPDRDDLGRWAALPTGASDPTRPSGDPFATVAEALAGPPTRLRISAIGVDTPLETLSIGRDGALQPPGNFRKAGWYADGTAPGDTGPTPDRQLRLITCGGVFDHSLRSYKDNLVVYAVVG
jgi:hypothetical protein